MRAINSGSRKSKVSSCQLMNSCLYPNKVLTWFSSELVIPSMKNLEWSKIQKDLKDKSIHWDLATTSKLRNIATSNLISNSTKTDKSRSKINMMTSQERPNSLICTKLRSMRALSENLCWSKAFIIAKHQVRFHLLLKCNLIPPSSSKFSLSSDTRILFLILLLMSKQLAICSLRKMMNTSTMNSRYSSDSETVNQLLISASGKTKSGP